MVRKHSTLLLTILFASIYIVVSAQQPSFTPITTNDGLSQNSVTSITQDSFGFMWIATQDGLNRYDGTNFTKYDAYFTDITNTSYSRLGKVYRDTQNRIWLITSDNRISYYSEKVDSILTIAQLKNASVILQKSKNEFWLGSYTEGLHLINIENSQVEIKRLIENISIDNILLANNQLLLSTNEGVINYNTETGSYENLFSSLSSDHVSDIVINKQNELYISTYTNGLYKSANLESVHKLKNLPNDLRIQDLYCDRKDNIWIASYDDGMYRLGENRLYHFEHNPPRANDINYNDILCIYEDVNGNIWMGTDGGGLSISKASQKPINCLTNEGLPPGMAVDVTRSISTDKNGNIWVGTSGKGLTLVEKSMVGAQYYSTSQEPPYYIPNNRIMSLHHDTSGELWVGTQEGGLLKYDRNSKEIVEVQAGLPCKTIWHISQKNNEELWLCTRANGLILYNTISQAWQQYSTPVPQSLRVMIKDESGTCFIGTDEGDLLKFDEEDGTFETIELELETGGIKSLLLSEKELWIGTQKEGIIVYNIENYSTRQIIESHGLPNKVIYSLAEQSKRYIWASTNKGICQIDKTAFANRKLNVVNQKLDIQNGLINNEFNTGAYHKDQYGTMYFGGIKGINWFNPNEILKNRKPIKLLFLELVTTLNSKISVTAIHNEAVIKQNYSNRHFQIRYTDLEYGNSKNIQFRYRLQGYNEEWINNENNRLISFSNIPPGEYTLQLSASNEDGIWNMAPKELQIEIIPAFWETWWFKMLVAMTGIFIGWYVLNLRIKSIKQTSQLQQELAQSEAKALKAQMNPHFLFNSLNAIDSYILNNNPEKASDYLSKFSKLIRLILDYSDLPCISLQQEIDILKLYVKMEQMRFSDKFDIKINISDHVKPSELQIPPLIIQPYVENAIWHGLVHLEKKGELNLSFNINADNLICVIRDNGIGRKKALENKSKSATKRKSHGMKIAQERLKLFNRLNDAENLVSIKDLTYESKESAGTQVTLKFPIMGI